MAQTIQLTCATEVKAEFKATLTATAIQTDDAALLAAVALGVGQPVVAGAVGGVFGLESAVAVGEALVVVKAPARIGRHVQRTVTDEPLPPGRHAFLEGGPRRRQLRRRLLHLLAFRQG